MTDMLDRIRRTGWLIAESGLLLVVLCLLLNIILGTEMSGEFVGARMPTISHAASGCSCAPHSPSLPCTGVTVSPSARSRVRATREPMTHFFHSGRSKGRGGDVASPARRAVSYAARPSASCIRSSHENVNPTPSANGSVSSCCSTSASRAEASAW